MLFYLFRKILQSWCYYVLWWWSNYSVRMRSFYSKRMKHQLGGCFCPLFFIPLNSRQAETYSDSHFWMGQFTQIAKSNVHWNCFLLKKYCCGISWVMDTVSGKNIFIFLVFSKAICHDLSTTAFANKVICMAQYRKRYVERCVWWGLKLVADDHLVRLSEDTHCWPQRCYKEFRPNSVNPSLWPLEHRKQRVFFC